MLATSDCLDFDLCRNLTQHVEDSEWQWHTVLGDCLARGFAGGISFLFAASAKQMPLLVRYTALRDEEFQKRLEELKDV